ncbi:MAG TPA: L,D-transpeptidase family protein [Allosphingosinicella sp.]|nr:L,D-transpeptidase family protein [Allosphingosinicella sp.]
MLSFLKVAVLSLLLGLSPLSPAAAKETAPLDAKADALKPGQFLWEPGRATGGPVEIVISLGLQRAYVYRGGTLIGVSTVSSGRTGHESPVGRFQILEKRKVHRSNRYNDAPMPFMQRLTWRGVALHAGEIPGRPASHGCIRLPAKFAQSLFEATSVGSSVFIADEKFASAKQALDMARFHASVPLNADRSPVRQAGLAP